MHSQRAIFNDIDSFMPLTPAKISEALRPAINAKNPISHDNTKAIT